MKKTNTDKTTATPKTPLMKYVTRKINGVPQKVGIILASVDKNGNLQYGWSLARVKPRVIDFGLSTNIPIYDKADTFKEDVALAKAKARLMKALNGSTELEPMPHTISAVLKNRFRMKKVLFKEGDGTKAGSWKRVMFPVRGFEDRAKRYFANELAN